MGAEILFKGLIIIIVILSILRVVFIILNKFKKNNNRGTIILKEIPYTGFDPNLKNEVPKLDEAETEMYHN